MIESSGRIWLGMGILLLIAWVVASYVVTNRDRVNCRGRGCTFVEETKKCRCDWNPFQKK